MSRSRRFNHTIQICLFIIRHFLFVIWTANTGGRFCCVPIVTQQNRPPVFPCITTAHLKTQHESSGGMCQEFASLQPLCKWAVSVRKQTGQAGGWQQISKKGSQQMYNTKTEDTQTDRKDWILLRFLIEITLITHTLLTCVSD